MAGANPPVLTALVTRKEAARGKVLQARPVGGHLKTLLLLASYFEAVERMDLPRTISTGLQLRAQVDPTASPIHFDRLAYNTLAGYGCHAVYMPTAVTMSHPPALLSIRFFHAEYHQYEWLQIDLESGEVSEYARSFGLTVHGTSEKLKWLAQFIVDNKLADNLQDITPA